MSKTEVAKHSEAHLPADYGDLEQYAGQGLNDLDSSDRSVPFLKVLEKNSPEVESVPGARPGTLIDTSTGRLYDSVRFVPACREHAFVEWVPVEKGGGLVSSYGLDEPISKWAATQRGKITLKNGNQLVETFYLFGILLPEEGDDSAEPKAVVISFTSTRIRAYKSIVNRSDSIMLMGSSGRKFKAPWFCHVWRIGTQKKQEGNRTWYLYTAEFDSPQKDAAGARLPADSEVVQMGAEMVRQKTSGELKVAQEGVAGEQPDIGSYGGQGRVDDRDEEEPPF